MSNLAKNQQEKLSPSDKEKEKKAYGKSWRKKFNERILKWLEDSEQLKEE